ncbi:MAG: hypothetical protein P8X52_01350, partial [Limibacillus sp.]
AKIPTAARYPSRDLEQQVSSETTVIFIASFLVSTDSSPKRLFPCDHHGKFTRIGEPLPDRRQKAASAISVKIQ